MAPLGALLGRHAQGWRWMSSVFPLGPPEPLLRYIESALRGEVVGRDAQDMEQPLIASTPSSSGQFFNPSSPRGGSSHSVPRLLDYYRRRTNHLPNPEPLPPPFPPLFMAGEWDEDRPAPSPPWRAILTSAPVWGIIIAHTSSNFSFYMLLTCLPTFLHNVLHFKIAATGALLAPGLFFLFIEDQCAVVSKPHPPQMAPR